MHAKRLTVELFTEEVDEHGEVKRARGFIEHLLELLVRGSATKGRVHVLQVLDINETITVLIDEGEGLSWEKKTINLLLLILIQ